MFVRLDKSGIWEGFIPDIETGENLINIISLVLKEAEMDKGDPFANFWEKRPLTASITWDLDYEWKDEEWMKKRKNIIHWMPLECL